MNSTFPRRWQLLIQEMSTIRDRGGFKGRAEGTRPLFLESQVFLRSL